MLRALQRRLSCRNLFDLFSEEVNWLFQSEQLTSITGGLLTILAFLLILALSYNTLATFFTFSSYSFSKNQQFKYPQPPLKIENSYFDVAIALQDYKGSKPSFAVQFLQINFTYPPNEDVVKSAARLDPVPCNLTQWENKFGPSVLAQMKLFGTNLQCLPPQFNFRLEGNPETRTNSSQVVIRIKRCTSEDCLTDVQLNALPTFKYSILYPEINYRLEEKVPYWYKLNSQYYWSYNKNYQNDLFSHISIASYILDDSDTDVWPTEIDFLHSKKQTQTYVMDAAINGGDPPVDEQLGLLKSYVYLMFVKSAKVVTVARSIYKLEDLISFLGGIFNLVFSIFIIFGETYNERRMKVDLGRNVRFSPDDPEETPLSDSFNFCDSLCYSIASPCLSENNFKWRLCRMKFLEDLADRRLSVDQMLARVQLLQQFVEFKFNERLPTLADVAIRPDWGDDLYDQFRERLPPVVALESNPVLTDLEMNERQQK